MTVNTVETAQLRHLIGGELTGELTGGRERRNPADGSDVVSVSAQATRIEVDAAVEAAKAAQPGWAAMPPPQRGAVLSRAAELLASRIADVARDLTREEGKTLAEARGEAQRAVDILRFYGGEGMRLSGQTFPTGIAQTLVFTKKEPVGVVVAITPWNFPIAIPAWKISPALVAGNAVVLKPASLTPLSAHHLAKALTDAGLPDGVLNVVFGPGAEIGNTLVDHPEVKAVTFTGSTEVGAEIHRRASARMIRVQLEMGGKNPLVVLDDADFVKAAAIAALGGFGLTGQACTATSRVIVTPGALEPFVAAMLDHRNRYRPGNGLSDGVLMGPVVDRAQMDRNISYVDLARKEGAVVVFGGESQFGESQFGESLGGLAFPPTLLGAVKPTHRIASEEVFGPVISLIEASDFDEALHIANDVPFGLSAGICTTDLGKAHQFADRVQAGVVKVNRPTTGLDLNVPFGGIKASSTGTYREQGSTATEFFTWSKSVYLGYDA